MGSFVVEDLGRSSYLDALAIQLDFVERVIAGSAPETLLFVEHPPVLTLGASFHAENLLHPVDWYESQGIAVHPTDRGGDVTYHGPGQLVAYPIFNLADRGKDLHLWMRNLEEAVIVALGQIGLVGERLPVNSGVWVDNKKVCAVGVKVRKWVSFHGIAVNCDVDLATFGTFVPCGIRTHGVTSISTELSSAFSVEDLKPFLTSGFLEVFDA